MNYNLNTDKRRLAVASLLVLVLSLSLFVVLFKPDAGVSAAPAFLQVSIGGEPELRTKLGVNDPAVYVASTTNSFSGKVFYTWSVTPQDSKVSIDPNGAKCTLTFLEATEDAYSLSVTAEDSALHNRGSASIAVYDPYTAPNQYIGSGASMPYSYLIESDGLGWYRAVNGQTGAVSWSSTNKITVQTSVINALSGHNGTIVMQGITWDTSVTIPDGITVFEYTDHLNVLGSPQNLKLNGQAVNQPKQYVASSDSNIVPVRGAWKIDSNSGLLTQYDYTTGVDAIYFGKNQTDSVVSSTITFSGAKDTSPAIGVIARYQPSAFADQGQNAKFYIFFLQFNTGNWENGLFYYDGSYHQLKAINTTPIYPNINNTFATITLNCTGTTISATIDGTTIGDYTDANIAWGYAGLATINCMASFQSINVTYNNGTIAYRNNFQKQYTNNWGATANPGIELISCNSTYAETQVFDPSIIKLSNGTYIAAINTVNVTSIYTWILRADAVTGPWSRLWVAFAASSKPSLFILSNGTYGIIDGYSFNYLQLKTSPDLRTWTTQCIVLNKGGATEWDNADIEGPFLIHDQTTFQPMKVNGNYVLYYYGSNTTTNRKCIGMATSSNLVNWTKCPANPILIGDLDFNRQTVFEYDIASMALFYVDELGGRTWYMLYNVAGTKAPSATTETGAWYMCIAKSTDGLQTWTKKSDTILNPTYLPIANWDSEKIYAPDVVIVGGVNYIIYNARTYLDFDENIGITTIVLT